MTHATNVMEPRDAELLAHYDRYLGPHGHIETYDDGPAGAPAPIHIIEFAPPSDEDVWVYVTVGSSRTPMPYPSGWKHERPELRAEYVFYSEHRCQEANDLLANIAIQPFTLNTFYAEGHTIGGPPGGVIHGSTLDDLLLARPYFLDDDFEIVHHHDGPHTHVLWVIPVSRAERLLVREHGDVELLKRFAEHEIDAADLRRKSVV